MIFDERTSRREMLIVVCQCNEGIFLVHLGFVYTPNSPLPRSIDPASNALTTRKLELNARGLSFVEGDTTPWPLVCSQGLKTRHLKTMTTSQN